MKLKYCLFIILILALIGTSFSDPNTDPVKGDALLAAVNNVNGGTVEEFIPTNEWQEVKAGQAVPPGLHIRMDLSTGKKMAKLIPENERVGRQIPSSNDRSQSLSPAIVQKSDGAEDGSVEVKEVNDPSTIVSAMFANLDNISVIHDDVASKEASLELKELPEGDQRILSINDVYNMQSSGKDYRDESAVAAARDRVKELNSILKPTDDATIIKHMMSLITSPSSSYEVVLEAFESLELLLHQVDNANDWVKMGGLDMVNALIAPASDTLEDEDEKLIPSDQIAVDRRVKALRLLNLQSSAARALSAASQNNPSVGRSAIDKAILPSLVSLVNQSYADINRDYTKLLAATEEKFDLKNYQSLTPEEGVFGSIVSLHSLRVARYRLMTRILYALGALIRHSENAQSILLSAGGPFTFRQLLTPLYSSNQLLSGIKICPVNKEGVDGSSNDAHSLLCVSESQLSEELFLHSSLYFRSSSLLHDIVVDFFVNWERSNTAPSLSSKPLFQSVIRKNFCSLYPITALNIIDLLNITDISSLQNVSALLHPNFAAMEARESLLYLMDLLWNNHACVPSFTTPPAVEAFKKIAEQQKFLFDNQKKIEEEKGIIGGTDSPLVSDYYREILTIAESLATKTFNMAEKMGKSTDRGL